MFTSAKNKHGNKEMQFLIQKTSSLSMSLLKNGGTIFVPKIRIKLWIDLTDAFYG